MNFQYPMLNSTNYTIWAVKIRAIFNVHGIWEVIEPTQGTEVDQKKRYSAIAMLYQELRKYLYCKLLTLNRKGDLDALKIRQLELIELRKARVQTLESEFEQKFLKMERRNYWGIQWKIKELVRKLLSQVPEKFMQIVAGNRTPFKNERTKKAVKEEDGSSSLLFSNVDEKTKEHKCEHCGHVNSSQERTERGRGKNWKPWKKKDGDQDNSQIRCYKCKELGHYKSECPKWEKEHEENLIQEDDEPTLL
ncbi:zinc finger, CCHC-type [Artemisia annua]|uniref:Zinc finger, CCHC-type n=1 Tax=Artemisia annua TaxID=35608 RepID=A0A2U1MQA5_ARTAN|nr:zinc finger, CCHC-type [Artemisia annua]